MLTRFSTDSAVRPRCFTGWTHRLVFLLGAIWIAWSVPGCILGNRPSFVHVGSRNDLVTFYLDGAGNYGFGKESVPLGLADGGYQGHVRHFIWTTYLGSVMDQVSVSHNRREGHRLARKIQQFIDDHPGGEVNVIGLSAGTGVVVFALESLEPRFHVQNVIMLSSSLSSDYDLTPALHRVDGGIYFLWSPDDPILQGVVPIVGTVDRSSRRTAPAGTWGARVPFGASNNTRKLYSDKVHNIAWRPKTLFGPVKYYHAGSVSREVIRDIVAPIIVHRSRYARKSQPKPQQKAPAPESPPHNAGPADRGTEKADAEAPSLPTGNQTALITVGGRKTPPPRSVATTRPISGRPISP